MFELTIKDQVYQFNFGFGFLKEINQRVSVPVDGLKDVKRAIGLQYAVAGIVDGDVEQLVEVLNAANKGFQPRVTQKMLEQYVEETDIDALFEQVLDFLKRANCTKNEVKKLMDAVSAKETGSMG